jgi:hypothetical protein
MLTMSMQEVPAAGAILYMTLSAHRQSAGSVHQRSRRHQPSAAEAEGPGFTTAVGLRCPSWPGTAAAAANS